MPSKSPEQARLMHAVASGWTPSRMKSPPSRAVAREFVNADRKYSGGFAENRYVRGGLAFMNEVDSNSERARPLRGFQRGGRRGGRRTNGGGGTPPTTNVPTVTAPDVSPYGTEAGTTQQMLDRMGYSGPMGYLRAVYGLREAGWTAASGSGDGDLRNTMWYPPEQTLTGEDAPPPRLIEADPASYIGGTASGTSDGGGGGGAPDEESAYRDQLRAHKAKIAATLGSARGGHVNYYEEGGKVRPGHPEGPNPYEGRGMPASYKDWEKRHHIEPPPPEEPKVAAAPEKVPWYMKIAGYGSKEEAEEIDDVVTGAQTGQAYGGRVRYQLGGLAIAAPAGGVPPWISPTGSGPGYMDEPPPGYQFGGIANRGQPAPVAAPAVGPAPIMAQAQSAFNAQTGGPRGGVMGGQYRGVPPQRGMISRGARGDPAAMAERMRGMAGSMRGAIPGGGGQPPGGLAAMMQQAQQQQRGFQGMAARGEMGPGTTTRYNMSPEAYRGATDAQRRAAEMMGGIPRQPGPDRFGNTAGNLAANREAANAWRESGMQGNVNDFMAENYPDLPQLQNTQVYDGGPGGMMGPGMPGGGRWGSPGGPGRVGEIGINPPPGGGRFGKPRPGPGMMPPGEEGGGIPGGPRVPPNMRGYLQRQRMMNRPPANVGGGANRVGMADQQGALSRAMQRGTGRAPPSRRFGRGRAGRGRGFEAQ